jgi:hypothetical protein
MEWWWWNRLSIAQIPVPVPISRIDCGFSSFVMQISPPRVNLNT